MDDYEGAGGLYCNWRHERFGLGRSHTQMICNPVALNRWYRVYISASRSPFLFLHHALYMFPKRRSKRWMELSIYLTRFHRKDRCSCKDLKRHGVHQYNINWPAIRKREMRGRRVTCFYIRLVFSSDCCYIEVPRVFLLLPSFIFLVTGALTSFKHAYIKVYALLDSTDQLLTHLWSTKSCG
jgi:hypothetical protein